MGHPTNCPLCWLASTKPPLSNRIAADRAVVQRRPIIAMLEPDATQEGGLDQAAVEKLITNKKLDKFNLRKKWDEWREDGELLPAAFDHSPDDVEVRAALFATPPVEWNRLPHVCLFISKHHLVSQAPP